MGVAISEATVEGEGEKGVVDKGKHELIYRRI